MLGNIYAGITKAIRYSKSSRGGNIINLNITNLNIIKLNITKLNITKLNIISFYKKEIINNYYNTSLYT